MATGFQPVGAALPPRRDTLIQSASAEAPTASGSEWGNSINVPLARDRMLEFFEREQLPGDVKSTLAAALYGDLNYQHLLFTAMIDTWPKLQKAIEEIARKVSVAPWKIHPYAERGEKPDSKAEKIAKDMESIVWAMKPRTQYLEKGLEGTMIDLVRFYYYGHGVIETRWHRGSDGLWKPRCTKTVPARYYGYPCDIETGTNGEDRLMFDPEGGMGARKLQDFPENRFLIAINTGHGGHPSTAAPLRALAAYWLAAVYGLKWFMSFTQLYGVPWRHAQVANPNDKNAVAAALDQIGNTGRIVTNPGDKIDILAPGSTSGASLPQRELIALADQQCDQFILGQTLTSGVSKEGGSRALGEVHQDTLNGVVDGVCDFVGGILTRQLIPAIAALNWGEALQDKLPEMWAKREEVKDEKRAAEIMEIKLRMGIPMSKAYVHESLNSPIPAEADDLFVPTSQVKETGKIERLEPEADEDDWLDEDESDEEDDAQVEVKDGDALISRITLDGEPDWQAEGANVPDDAYPEEDEPRTTVAAADASANLTVDQLSNAVLEGLTGVSREWLSPVRPTFERLAALAMSKHVTDEDFIAALENAQRQMPELFDLLNTNALQTAFEKSIGSAALAGSVSG